MFTDLLLISLLVCCTIMVLVWVWAYKIKNASVVDIFWAFNFPAIAIILLFFAEGFETRKIMICTMVLISYIRLGIHLSTRVLSHIEEEEGRYKQLREDWKPNPELKFFIFFQFQAISNVILAIPFFIIAINTTPEIKTIEYIAFFIWLISFIGEAIADKQLANFKQNPQNKGKVCDTGLWNYSRHPNYFFQWMMWLSYFIFALGSPYGYFAIVSPVIILYLLLKVTGIPATEEQSLKSKGEAYRKYQYTTSKFIPWFKK